MKHRRLSDQTLSIQTEPVVERFPSISPHILNEAIEQDILPRKYKNKIIINPNKYSIFFSKFDSTSPIVREALQNLNLKESDIKPLTFQQFCSQSYDTLENVVTYLYYMTEHYEKLKVFQAEMNRIKNLKKQKAAAASSNNTAAFFLTSQISDSTRITATTRAEEDMFSSSHPSNNNQKHAKFFRLAQSQSNQSSFSQNFHTLPDRPKSLLRSYEDKQHSTISKHKKYTEMIDFVRQDRVDNFQNQRKYEGDTLKNIEERLEQREKDMKKKSEAKAKELQDRINRVKQRAQYRQDKIDMMVEKKYEEMDVTGEKHEDRMRKISEKRFAAVKKFAFEHAKKQRKLKRVLKKLEEDDIGHRESLSNALLQKENLTESILARNRELHEQKCATQKLKYDSTIAKSIQINEEVLQNRIQRTGGIQDRIVVQTDLVKKGLEKHSHDMQVDHQKKMDKFQKKVENNEYRQERIMDKLKNKLEHKASRYDAVEQMVYDRSVESLESNHRRHRKANRNYEHEISHFGKFQSSVMSKHSDISERVTVNHNHQKKFVGLASTLSHDLFEKRAVQFDNIK